MAWVIRTVLTGGLISGEFASTCEMMHAMPGPDVSKLLKGIWDMLMERDGKPRNKTSGPCSDQVFSGEASSELKQLVLPLLHKNMHAVGAHYGRFT